MDFIRPTGERQRSRSGLRCVCPAHDQETMKSNIAERADPGGHISTVGEEIRGAIAGIAATMAILETAAAAGTIAGIGLAARIVVAEYGDTAAGRVLVAGASWATKKAFEELAGHIGSSIGVGVGHIIDPDKTRESSALKEALDKGTPVRSDKLTPYQRDRIERRDWA